MSYRIETIALIGASLVHGGAIALGFVAPDNAMHTAMVRDRTETTEIEVELTPLPPTLDEGYADGQPLARITPTPGLDNRRVVTPRGPRVDPLTAEPEQPVDGEPTEEGWSIAPELGGGDASEKGGWTPGTGIHAAPVWMGAGILPRLGAPDAAPTTAPRRKVDTDIATTLLNDSLRAKDKELGLDFPGGTVIASSIKSAVLASALSGTAAASFAVVVNAAGQVQGVTLSGASGNSAEWGRVAQAAAAALAGRALPMRGAYRAGAVVTVQVNSTMRLPSGTVAGEGGPQASATQTFDVTDIGSRAKRVVTARYSATPVR